MSRNFRQKIIPPPAQKVSSRRKQNIEESSDDDYGGVDQISDSEEDEPDVEVAEEQAIIESEDDQDTPRPFLDEGQWDGFVFDGQAEILGQDVDFFEEHLAALAGASDGDIFQTASEDEVVNTRRVRFNLSDSETADEDDGFFPDIFLPKDELDSSFRREIDQDDGDGMLSDGSWEANESFELPEAEIARAIEENEDSSNEEGNSGDESGTGSSGYDSDDSGGYTTDEDLPAAARFAPPRLLTRQNSQSSSEEEIQRTPIRRGPKLGVWTVSNNRPFMIAKNEMKLLMYNRGAMRRFSVDAVPETPVPTPSRNNSFVESSPMISNSGNIMMSAMANFGDPFSFNTQFLGGHALGPPEAFYPFTSINADGTMVQDSSSAYDEDDMDDEDLWNLEDILDLGGEESENENGEEVEQSSDAATPAPSSTPARPTTARSEDQVHPLLDHFEKGVVGSFRRNQNRHQLLTRNIATRDSLAFGGAHLDGTIRGVKSGRLHHANTPITPARKAKTLKPVHPSSPASPLAYTQLNKKRKYNGEEFNGHKRNKSLI
ncbi:hypothetical protein EG329_004324 [Mollisiaceae sp. DMI_Dod_QoI]|nr:hypothetical protein EG329_004324 [Helotiales sp. DMI_Dod_QoI]